MLTVGLSTLCLATGIVSAQLTSPPVERNVFPMPYLNPPLWSHEIDVVNDLGAALLNGPVESVRLKSYYFDEEGMRLPNAETTMNIAYDRCGNIWSVELGSEWDGVEEIERSIVLENTYEEQDCHRVAVRFTSNAVGGAENEGGSIEYDDRGRLVSSEFGAARTAIVRVEDTIQTFTVSRLDFEEEEKTTYAFDPETSRVISIEDSSGKKLIRWSDDKHFEIVDVLRDDVQVIGVSLDDHCSIVEVTVPESESVGINFGHKILREYTYDVRGNWTSRLMSFVKKPGDEPVKYDFYSREIIYREDG